MSGCLKSYFYFVAVNTCTGIDCLKKMFKAFFAEDFRYVFGENWKDKLRIPPKPPVLSSKNDAYSFFIPVNHITWVYHLLLAKNGKIDHCIPSYGYSIGGINNKDMSIKFAECIEAQLLNAGVRGIRLALELDTICGTIQRLPNDVCGGHIKIESLCHFPTYRLWKDKEDHIKE